MKTTLSNIIGISIVAIGTLAIISFGYYFSIIANGGAAVTL